VTIYSDEHLDRVAAAIEAAMCPHREGPFGLYDYAYSNPNPPAQPHHVRDFRDPRSEDWGRTVFKSASPDEARAEYDARTRRHIAQAALDAHRMATSA
jgi:hypothetical protein